MPKYTNKNLQAFTMIEISMVIVVIALLVAGVTVGQKLVKQAKIRSVITDISEYTAAVNAFKLQYEALPGDFDNAFSYWGTDCAATAGACNGDGNSKLITATADMTENLMFWQHLTLADLIDGSYVSTDQGDPNSLPGINVPQAPLEYSGYYTLWWDSFLFSAKSANAIALTLQYKSGAQNYFAINVIRPADARAIDKKFDDGMPATGMVYSDGDPDCTSQRRTFSGDPTTVTYVFTDTGPVCRMWFWLENPM